MAKNARDIHMGSPRHFKSAETFWREQLMNARCPQISDGLVGQTAQVFGVLGTITQNWN